MVKIQEAEQQIATHYEVYDERPSDCDLLLPALDVHEELFARTPYLLTADAAFFSQHNEATAQTRGVKRVAIPNRSTKSPKRKKLQKTRWFRNAQKWRTGSEGRISLLIKTPWTEPLSLQRTARHQALGRLWRHRR